MSETLELLEPSVFSRGLRLGVVETVEVDFLETFEAGDEFSTSRLIGVECCS